MQVRHWQTTTVIFKLVLALEISLVNRVCLIEQAQIYSIYLHLTIQHNTHAL